MPTNSDDPDYSSTTPSPTTKTSAGRPSRELSLRANTAANVTSKLVGILIALALSPFIVHKLGLATFGFWALISSLSQYASLLDFGIGTALMRYVASLSVDGDDEHLTRKVASGLLTAILFAAAVITCFALLVLLLPEGVTHSWPHGWRWAVIGVGVSLACLSVASVYQALPRGLSRWDLHNIPVIVSQVTYGLSAVGLLLWGAGLAGLGTALALGGVALVISARVCGKKVWAGPWRLRGARRKDVMDLVRYGTNLQVSGLAVVVNAQADKPLVLAFGGSLKLVGYYELGSRVAIQLRALPVALLGPLTVRAAVAGQTTASIRQFYVWALRLITRLGVGPLFALYGACYPLSLAWLGTGYGATAGILVILGLGYGTNLIAAAGTAVADGCGRPDLSRNLSLRCLMLNLSLSLVLGLAFGPWGIIASTAVSLVVCSLWFLRSVDAWLELRQQGLHGSMRRVDAHVLVGVVWAIGTIIVTELLAFDTRLENLLVGVAAITLYGSYSLVALPELRSLGKWRRRHATASEA